MLKRAEIFDHINNEHAQPGSSSASAKQPLQNPVAHETHTYGPIEQHSGNAVTAEPATDEIEGRQANHPGE